MTYYREAQKLPPFLWWILLPSTALMTYGFYQQLILERPFGSQPMSDTWMVLVWLIFGVALPIFLYVLELRTEVRDDGIHARFYPLPAFKPIGYDQIARSYVRQYRPIMEYGGWGLRFSRNGTAYNMRGTEGVQLELETGKKVLIGSQDAAGLQRAIEQARAAG